VEGIVLETSRLKKIDKEIQQRKKKTRERDKTARLKRTRISGRKRRLETLKEISRTTRRGVSKSGYKPLSGAEKAGSGKNILKRKRAFRGESVERLIPSGKSERHKKKERFSVRRMGRRKCEDG